MSRQILGLYRGVHKYKTDMLWALFIWIVFSFMFALTPFALIWGSSYFRGEAVQIVSSLAVRGDLSLICIGIVASAIGKFADSPKQDFKLRLAISVVGMIAMFAHLILYVIIRQQESKLESDIVDAFYTNAFILTVLTSAIVVLWAELKPYHPRGR